MYMQYKLSTNPAARRHLNKRELTFEVKRKALPGLPSCDEQRNVNDVLQWLRHLDASHAVTVQHGHIINRSNPDGIRFITITSALKKVLVDAVLNWIDGPECFGGRYRRSGLSACEFVFDLDFGPAFFCSPQDAGGSNSTAVSDA